MKVLAFEVGGVDLDWFLGSPSERCAPYAGCNGGVWDRYVQSDAPPARSLDGVGTYFGMSTAPFLGGTTQWYLGYTSSMPILRRFAKVYADATGVSLTRAFGLVASHALAGFHGDLQGGPSPGLVGFMEQNVPGFDARVEQLKSVLGTAPGKERLPMPVEFTWQGDTKKYFAIHLLGGLGTDYTLTTDRMSEGLFTYDVPDDRPYGLLEVLPDVDGMRYLVLRLQ